MERGFAEGPEFCPMSSPSQPSLNPDEVSTAIRSLYEVYPYPERPPGEAADPFLDLFRSLSSKPEPGRLSFLDAGCGTGVHAIGGAHVYPHFDVFAADMNRKALADIEDDSQSMGLTNLTTAEMDLRSLPEDFGPKRGFDIIFVIGVIHHSAEPSTILRRLAQRLAPQGILRVMVYGDLGRSDLYRFARVAKQLYCREGREWEDRLADARRLMGELHRSGQSFGVKHPPLRGPWTGAHDLDDAEFADRYLNPHDQPFSSRSLLELGSEVGLNFLRWTEPREWDLEALLPSLKRQGVLPDDPLERFAVVEELFDRPKLDALFVGPDFELKDTRISLSTYIHTNPQVFLESVSVRGRPIEQSVRLRFGPSHPVTREQGQLLSVLSNRIATLGNLLEEWSERDNGPLWLKCAQDLIDRELLFIPSAVDI